MPEIKHQFTGGKMNKDLNERLVPNGEYRDALNIQVSTSEDSDVGTVQNILGNSLIAGQNFIPTNSVCVGSIADEKNDKLYYFITQREFLNIDFAENSETGWTLDTEWEVKDNQLKATAAGTSNSNARYSIPGANNLVAPKSYKVIFTISDYTQGEIRFILYGQAGKIGSTTSARGNGTYTKVVTIDPNSATASFFDSILIQPINSAFTGNIDNISIREAEDVIVEFNSTTNVVTPVLVDTKGSALKFNSDNIITGINIIDDLLFWTDNESEPKKINIQRSIDGTDSGGTTHTNVVNNKVNVGSIPIEEKHITVIKRGPSQAPKIEMVSERDESLTYTGVMRITEPYSGTNPSSFNVSGSQTRFDFNGDNTVPKLKVGDHFQTEIETDINGNSGFTLQWDVGDTILFKEFVDGNPPALPITNYTIKAVISQYFWPNSQAGNRFADSSSEEAVNGNFVLPNTSGSKPSGYDWSSSVFTYSSINNRVEVNLPSDGTNQQFDKIFPTTTTAWNTGGLDTYRIKINLSGVTHGGVNIYIVSDEIDLSSSNPYYWQTGGITNDGDTIIDITVDTSLASSSSDKSTYANKFIIQTSADGFVGNINSISIVNLNATNARVRCKITDIVGTPPPVPVGEGELKYAVDRQDTGNKLYEFKFPRFAIRYKYEDGEYSVFSPFTSVAFLPGSFDYHPLKGYNIGMTNRLSECNLYANTSPIPADQNVVSIDVLYKEDGSPNVYVLDSIKPALWTSAYNITSETIKSAVQSNQLLRPWDNVPKKALGQAITGNRIVYANYEQGYDLVNNSGGDYSSNIELDFTQDDISNKTMPSVKSSRDYQVGIVYADRYGRETPIMPTATSSGTDSKRLDKSLAEKANKISVTFKDSNFIKDAKFFKLFVRETSGEYYNMAMDRFWDAEDDHVWVSFPSSDRNKIDIDSFLILKKGVDSSNLIKDPARYKVIAIENEAPDFIKTKKSLIDEKIHNYASGDNVFDDNLNDAPVAGENHFKLNYTPFLSSAGSNIDLINDGSIFYIEFTNTSETSFSNRYRINKIDTNWRYQTVSTSEAAYSIKLEKALGTDIDFISDGSKIKDGTVVTIYKYSKENSPEFDGRFFVKLLNDSVFDENISSKVGPKKYATTISKKLYYLKDDITTTHHGDITGLKGAYSLYSTGSSDFNSYAAFFRNYKHVPNEEQLNDNNGNPVNVGQFRFGLGDHWKDEFLEYTSSGSSDWENAWYPSRNISNLKQADKYPSEDPNEEDVWFIDEGDFEGKRLYNENLAWESINNFPSSKNGISNTNTHTATLSIAIGGIFDSQVASSGSPNIDEFFNIGVSGGNSNYDDGDTINLVSKFNSGIKFRFKEDPDQTIYTVQSFTSERLLRYANSDPLPWDSKSKQIAQFAPNFTKDWDLKIKNPNGTGAMGWKPTGSLGPIISSGLSLSVEHSDISPTTTYGNVIVVIKSLTGVDTNTSQSHEIKVGMILVSHSGGGASDLYDGSADKEYLAVWKIQSNANGVDYDVHLTGYSELLKDTHDIISSTGGGNAPTQSGVLIFKQPRMNGYSQFSANRINQQSASYSMSNPGLYAVGYNMEFLKELEAEDDLPDNPAVWETEPKEDAALDVFYEASDLKPIKLQDDTKGLAIPIGSIVTHENSASIPAGNYVSEVGYDSTGWYIKIDGPEGVGAPFVTGDFIVAGDFLQITKPNGGITVVNVTAYTILSGIRARKIYVSSNLLGNGAKYILNWHNCYSFGNGVESNRVRDSFNLPYISKGVKVSTTLENNDEYKKDRRKYGLIYSGLYNSNGGVNNLNQFIAAEKITKDINPIYGSIQKLHSGWGQSGDLVALCEDRILKVLANKDALYNADGDTNITSTNNVLGTTTPYSGEYGISKNPESFASDAYRIYFTDRVRGAVMRLSMDGLTPISDHGMKDWFKDNLKLSTKLIGSYDDRKDEYNITLEGDPSISSRETPGYPTTVSFKEDVRGWVSFKSFTPENGISCANDYYTMLDGKLWKHHDESQDRNKFYDVVPHYNSSVNVLLNDGPGSVKSFHTLGYEGSQSKIDKFSTDGATGLSDDQPYNLADVDGWYVSGIETDKQKGSLNEFIEKEGKWFNYIKGVDSDVSSETDFAASNIQGIGELTDINSDVLTLDSINISLQVGDIIYYQTPGTNGSFNTIDSSSITKYGDVDSITNNTITVSPTGAPPTISDFIFFAKNNVVNTSSLLGYYADVKLENNSKFKAEIFSISSEVTESSK